MKKKDKYLLSVIAIIGLMITITIVLQSTGVGIVALILGLPALMGITLID